MLNDLPIPIKNMILEEANGEENYPPMPNSYRITELIGCIRKVYYRRTQPKKMVELETAKNFYRGNTWDRAFCKCFPYNQIRVTYRCKRVPISIVGHFDFLNEDDPTAPIITDLKSPKTLFYVEKEGKPNEQYRKQILFYCFCSAIPNGAIMYWDGHKSITYPVEATEDACAPLIEELETKSHLLWLSLKNGKAPTKNAFPPETWECGLCEFVTDCNKE